MKTWAGWWVLLIAVLFASAARADEEILSFDATIEVQADGSLEVTESIRVRGEAVDIRRGIYRDFPTEYGGENGLRHRVKFEVLGATRDGAVENWFTEPQSNGTRVYLGRPEVNLDPGEYTYALRYRTDRQLGFFEDHDELYWNVTGNGWVFRIDSATAVVKLPASVEAARLRATAAELTAQVVDGGARYATTAHLAPSEGLTVVLEFPKGLVPEPSSANRIGWMVADNLAILIGVIGLGAAWGFYGQRWNVLGRDPDAGPRIPLYEPPSGLSAASMSFLRSDCYDDQCLAVAILSLAAQGLLSIERDESDVFRLRRTGEGDPAHISRTSEKRQVVLNRGSHPRKKAAVCLTRWSWPCWALPTSCSTNG